MQSKWGRPEQPETARRPWGQVGADMQGADGTSSPQRRETLEEMPAISHF
ncbi:hypothetical protein GCM10010317_097570 [Streptomyces mirabilis]|nr:hypothetical protein GCM10010317_097570 [Streptomyces mirabilis]